MKKSKSHQEAHSSRSQKGMGDNYGTGIKNPMGRIRDSYIFDQPRNTMRKPPKSLA